MWFSSQKLHFWVKNAFFRVKIVEKPHFLLKYRLKMWFLSLKSANFQLKMSLCASVHPDVHLSSELIFGKNLSENQPKTTFLCENLWKNRIFSSKIGFLPSKSANFAWKIGSKSSKMLICASRCPLQQTYRNSLVASNDSISRIEKTQMNPSPLR